MDFQVSYKEALEKWCNKIKPRDILEWGPGDSTELMLKTCPEAHIVSIEHNDWWLRKARSRFQDKVELVHMVLSMKGGESTGYVNYPILNAIENGKSIRRFDLVFVDGRMRNDCLVTAYQIVKYDGVVILHDSHRKNYHSGVKIFPYFHFDEATRTAIMRHIPL